jgi:hypothetical protein
LASPSKAPCTFFGWTLEDVTAHLLVMAAMGVTTVEAAVSNLAPSPPAVAMVALAHRLQTILAGVLSAPIKMDASGTRTSSAMPVVGPATSLLNVTCIEKYKKEASADTKDKIEEAWLARWKSELGNPSKKPRRVMKAYIDYLDSTVDAVDEQMCWECWPEDDGGDVFEDSA